MKSPHKQQRRELAQLDGRRGVVGNKDSFYRCLVRLVFLNQGLKLGEYDSQALGKLTGASLDSTIVYRRYTVTIDLDDADTGHSRTGIDTEYSYRMTGIEMAVFQL